jgi:hypothetical protein
MEALIILIDKLYAPETKIFGFLKRGSDEPDGPLCFVTLFAPSGHTGKIRKKEKIRKKKKEKKKKEKNDARGSVVRRRAR